MKKSKIVLLITIAILSIAMIACAFGGENNNGNTEEAAPAAQNEPADEVEEPAQEEAAPAEAEAETTVDTEFPLLPDAEGVMEMEGTVIYQSKTSLADAFDFYQTEFSSQGLTENEILTLNDETMFQLVFTGSADGKSLVVQTIQLDDTTINVTVRYE